MGSDRWRAAQERGRRMTRKTFDARLALAACLAILTTGQALAQTATPQQFVVCTGQHALCSFATHCELSADGTHASCNCWDVNDTFIVNTAAILDASAKQATLAACTDAHPCATNEAPVCTAIASHQFMVNGVSPARVSAFSYVDFCKRFNPVSCSAGPWASCMTAACDVTNKDPNKPLTCSCPVIKSPFIGVQGSCEQPRNTVMSTIPATFNFSALPGSAFVLEACQALRQ
jgi:hypothetical protein